MRLYRCPRCGKAYTHDEAHRHCMHECPKLKQKGAHIGRKEDS